jgi:uncharacterized membrane protein YidH (DUF202 family)
MGRARREAEQAVRGAVRNPWVERLARFGYAARGVVYAVIGLLAVQTAFSGRGSQDLAQQATPRGALQSIAEQSRLLLALVAIGLAGYALWRFVQGGLDTENKGSDPKGLVTRGSMVASGIVYTGLAIAAARLVSGNGGGASGGSQGFTADLMSKPFGRWLVVLIGIGIMVSGGYQLYDTWSKKFRKRLKLQEMSPDEERLATRTGQFGLAARGIVFLLSGWFLIQAGLRFDPSEAQGLGGALEALARQPSGPWLLGIVALGLIAYGAYSFLQARYRRIVF